MSRRLQGEVAGGQENIGQRTNINDSDPFDVCVGLRKPFRYMEINFLLADFPIGLLSLPPMSFLRDKTIFYWLWSENGVVQM